ncbi:hypothetical protein B5E60_03880 [Alistipes sp. An116]|uniref:nucleotide-binding protein n=1 Tax=Alistipes TaxID=239759 RepID=UPI000B37C435|nr:MULTISPECIES: AAA family ATPase [Alistipes]OUQ54061.1 hypothetical protein B5E60_03880 [Alistipes sp. An116]
MSIICNQKGGVGKPALTTLLASYLHYVCKCKVLVVDCDYPQWSIYTQRIPRTRSFRLHRLLQLESLRKLTNSELSTYCIFVGALNLIKKALLPTLES